MTIRLMLVDDHPLLREGLRRSMTDRGFDVVGEARDGREAIRLAAELEPDVILMDVTMPDVDGVEATRQIKHAMPAVTIVMLTLHTDLNIVEAARGAGASGYLVKDCSTDEIANAVRLAVSGRAPWAPLLAASIIAQAGTPDHPDGDGLALTNHEGMVIRLVADGLSTPEVAERLVISQKAVKNHLASIYRKLEDGGWNDDGDDGGAARVREPRRPIAPSDAGWIELLPPASGDG